MAHPSSCHGKDGDLEAGNYYVVEGKYLTLCTAAKPALELSRNESASMASQGNNDDGDLEAGVIEEGKYLGLYRAIVQESWDEAQKLFSQYGIVVPLNNNLDTALHVVARRHASLSFAEKLIAKLPADDEALFLKNRKGLAPLHLAARYGNIEVAKILVQKNSKLLYDRCKENLFPIHYAARNTLNSVEVYCYFLSVTKVNEDGEANPYEGPSGATILVNLIKSKFYGVANELVEKYPDLTSHHTRDKGTYPSDKETYPLEAIVKYDCPIFNKTTIHWFLSKIIVQEKMCFSGFLSKIIVQEKMLMHEQAMKLLKCLCDKLKILKGTQVASLAKNAIIEAAYLDIEEVVQNIVEAYPTTAYYQDKTGRNILHIAVENRCINVFNLVCGPGRTSVLMHDLVDERDNNGNNIVHLAGKLTPSHKLNNLVSVAALKMQRELQWFKEVKKIAPPYFSSLKNKDGKTPEMVFTDEHKDLKDGAEKWMKDTATSCIIVAALIVTIMFAAAITVPGGSSGESSDDGYIGNITFPVSNVFGKGFNTAQIVVVPNATTHKSGVEQGNPFFSENAAFKVFYISNAASLFTSVTSLLLFLSILTSRFKEEDFLSALPTRLIVGLFTLLDSIVFMMTAFATTVFLVFRGDKFGVLKASIVLIIISCVPVVSFVTLQFRLLVALLWSTYGWGIFHKKRGVPQMLF